MVMKMMVVVMVTVMVIKKTVWGQVFSVTK